MFSQGRIRLLIAGIISLLLLSSFSIWRIIRDGWRIEKANERYAQMNILRDRIQDVSLLVVESRDLTASGIFLPENFERHARLRQLLSVDYKRLRYKLISGDGLQSEYQNSVNILKKVDELRSLEEKVMGQLKTFKDYEGENLKVARGILEHRITPLSDSILSELSSLQYQLNVSTDRTKIQSQTEIDNADEVSLFLSVLMFISGILGLIIILSAKKIEGPK